MEIAIAIAFLSPLIVLIIVLVRYANRIRRETVDQELRTEHLDALNPAIVRYVLERDRHTCQRCGAARRVGVDFTGPTPDEDREITASDLAATCADCYFRQWTTLRETPAGDETS